jgi:amino acid transporter
MSRNGWLPAFFSAVNPRTHTPVRATLVAGGLTVMLALAIPLLSLARITSGMVLVVFILVNLSLLRIKLREPTPPGVRPLPVWIPLAGALASGFILAASI